MALLATMVTGFGACKRPILRQSTSFWCVLGPGGALPRGVADQVQMAHDPGEIGQDAPGEAGQLQRTIGRYSGSNVVRSTSP